MGSGGIQIFKVDSGLVCSLMAYGQIAYQNFFGVALYCLLVQEKCLLKMAATLRNLSRIQFVPLSLAPVLSVLQPNGDRGEFLGYLN